MRDSRKFCFPKSIKTPQEGDVLITLKNGKQAYISFQDLGKVKNIIKNYVILEDERNYSKKYLTFEALEDGTFTFSTNALQYSLDDGTTWTTLSAGTTTPTVTAGNKILWKQTGLTPSSTNPKGIGTFSATGNFKAYGNIMSLYYGDDFEGQTNLTGKQYTFYRLFRNNNKLVNANNLVLPATILADYCYNQMFLGCPSLTTAPKLPATTLAANCYNGMFSGCTTLTTAPELPATTLAANCYSGMFSGCPSLTTAPELPATTLAEGCYSGMFFNCTSLTTAPELAATTLAHGCYQSMFQGCTSLTTVELPATTLATSCYDSMFAGCTSLVDAPELPVTTLSYQCYSGMFQGCTSLTTAPALPATTLANYCYSNMFKGCSSLNYIKCLATNISETSCTNNWVNGVAATGTFIKADSMSSWSTGSNGIPSGWIVESA